MPGFTLIADISKTTPVWQQGFITYNSPPLDNGPTVFVEGDSGYVYGGANGSFLNIIDVFNIPTSLTISGKVALGQSTVNSIALNGAIETRAYIAAINGASIVNISNRTAPTLLSQISGTEFLGSYYYQFPGGGNTYVMLTFNSTNNVTNTISSYNISADTFSLVNSLQVTTIGTTNIPIGQIRPYPTDGSIMYVTSAPGSNGGNGSPIYLWVIQLAANGTLTQMPIPLREDLLRGTFLENDPITHGDFLSGNFMVWKGHTYFIINSSDGYFDIILADNPLSPVLLASLNPFNTAFLPTQSISQIALDSSFKFYVTNRTNQSSNVLQVMILAYLLGF
jgi:hypothetical protein